MCFWRGRSAPAIRAIAVPSLLAPGLALALFVFRVDADHPHYAFAVDDLALITNLFYRCSYFHNGSYNLCEPAARPFATFLFISIHDSAAIQIVGRKLNRHLVPRKNAYEILPHLTRNMRQHLVLVFQFHAEHGIG